MLSCEKNGVENMTVKHLNMLCGYVVLEATKNYGDCIEDKRRAGENVGMLSNCALHPTH